ncbi:hypothetical protein EDD21DRAFT_365784 [Dissophora ornata]|nr:hypothetical protein EDD21DRAFT_365784 [Dissophora ornata]
MESAPVRRPYSLSLLLQCCLSNGLSKAMEVHVRHVTTFTCEMVVFHIFTASASEQLWERKKVGCADCVHVCVCTCV